MQRNMAETSSTAVCTVVFNYVQSKNVDVYFYVFSWGSNILTRNFLTRFLFKKFCVKKVVLKISVPSPTRTWKNRSVHFSEKIGGPEKRFLDDF